MSKKHILSSALLLMHGSAFTMMHSGKMINKTLSLQLKRNFQPKHIESKKKLTKEEKSEMIMMGAVGLLVGSVFLAALKDCKDRYHRNKYKALCREHYIFPNRYNRWD